MAPPLSPQAASALAEEARLLASRRPPSFGLRQRPWEVLLVSVPEFGHLLPLLHIGHELVRRGHRAAVVSLAFAGEFVQRARADLACEFIGLLPELGPPEAGEGEHAEFRRDGKLMSLYRWYCEAMREHVRDLIRERRPDVVVADFMSFCLFGVYGDCKVPLVINFPQPVSLSMPLMIPAAPAFCSVFVPFLAGLPSSEVAMFRKMALCLGPRMVFSTIMVNSFEGLEDHRLPLPPNVVLTGPPAPRPMGKVLETSMAVLDRWLAWVRKERFKVAYVSLGDAAVLEAFHVQSLACGLERVASCAFLWSLPEGLQELLPGGGPAGLSRRFFIHKWLPQAAILRLPDVAVVVTHCGWDCLTEIVAAGKPMVAIPFSADQPETARIAQRRGVAEVLDPRGLSADAVEGAVRRILSAPSFAEQAVELQAALLRSGGAHACAAAVERAAERGRAAGEGGRWRGCCVCS